ncbi:MAG TPA: T9SS type A sorting domain-containing protein, partial [Bacteroidia bacterium]
YVDNEWNLNTGPIAEGNLRAQRWNGAASPNGWQGLSFGNAPNTAANTQTTAVVASTDLFRWWTLTDNTKLLPVEFLTASAECSKGNKIISWSTASEQNADYFSVERSLDGINFTSIATVQAAGNSSTLNNYSVADNDAFSGTVFYRIEEIDFNGSKMHFGTISSKECDEGFSMDVYPNPIFSSDMLNVAITGSKNDKVIIVVADMLGREFFSEVVILSSNQQVIAIDPSHKLAAGVYIIIATNNDEVYKKKIVIQ